MLYCYEDLLNSIVSAKGSELKEVTRRINEHYAEPDYDDQGISSRKAILILTEWRKQRKRKEFKYVN